MPECKKRELEALKNMNEKSSGSEQEISGLADSKGKPEVSPTISVNDQKLKSSPPPKDQGNENYSVVDKTFMETQEAIEHLTSKEQTFLLPPAYWDTVIEKEEARSDTDVGEKKSVTSPSLAAARSRSLFSPIKDFDLSSFDDELAENNNLNDGPFSLASLSLFANDLAYKEDTKEDSVRETLNLVEKLKSEMARKKNSNSGENIDTTLSSAVSDVTENMVVSEDSESVKRESPEKTCLEAVSVEEPVKEKVNVEDKETQPIEQHPAVEMFSSESYPSDILQPKPNATPNKEPVSISEAVNNTNVTWPQPLQPYDESASPYTQDVTMTDRWSESAMIPSRRSDCSSLSVSSNSSSSSTYSENHQTNESVSNVENVPGVDNVPSLEIPQHLQKSVTDLLRPNFNAVDAPENVYNYEDHFQTTFASTTPKSDKSIYPNVPPVSQPPSMFTTPVSFDPMPSFSNAGPIMAKPYIQPLTIQTPCAAIASFTTTSQNMAMINSLISPVAPLSSDEVIATPVSGNSVNFDEKFAELVSESAGISANVTGDADVDAEKELPQLTKESKDNYCEENEKENDLLFKNVTDLSGNTAEIVRPLAEKNDNESKNDSLCKTIESAPVTSTCLDENAPVSAPVSVQTPPMKTPQTPSHKKKSPARPTRASARVSSLNKSPVAKSPIANASPALSDKVTGGKGKARESASRKNNRASAAPPNRRGRGRGRGRNALANCFYR
jgi:hypothetical protein